MKAPNLDGRALALRVPRAAEAARGSSGSVKVALLPGLGSGGFPATPAPETRWRATRCHGCGAWVYGASVERPWCQSCLDQLRLPL
jgi:hypothetical protein